MIRRRSTRPRTNGFTPRVARVAASTPCPQCRRARRTRLQVPGEDVQHGRGCHGSRCDGGPLGRSIDRNPTLQPDPPSSTGWRRSRLRVRAAQHWQGRGSDRSGGPPAERSPAAPARSGYQQERAGQGRPVAVAPPTGSGNHASSPRATRSTSPATVASINTRGTQRPTDAGGARRAGSGLGDMDLVNSSNSRAPWRARRHVRLGMKPAPTTTGTDR